MVKETAYYEAKRIATQLDKIYDSDMTNRLVASLASPSYTLKEIEALAWVFVDGNDASGDQDAPDAIKLRMFMGAFCAWLAKREREGSE